MPLDNEFQRKQQLQAQQLQQSMQPATDAPEEHPEDILVVRNILVDDDEEIEEPIPYAVAKSDLDPNTGAQHFINRQETHVYDHSWRTKDFFEVRWDGRPHRIPAGKERLMPRYLADHFAKHLIDYILIRREKKEGLTNLLRNRLERTALYQQIIVRVESYYNSSLYDFQREGDRVEQQIQQLNRQPQVQEHNLGEVPHPALGYTTDEPPELVKSPEPPKEPAAPQQTPPTQPRTQQDLINSKSVNQLREEAKQLGIKLTGKETKEQLGQMIVNF